MNSVAGALKYVRSRLTSGSEADSRQAWNGTWALLIVAIAAVMIVYDMAYKQTGALLCLTFAIIVGVLVGLLMYNLTDNTPNHIDLEASPNGQEAHIGHRVAQEANHGHRVVAVWLKANLVATIVDVCLHVNLIVESKIDVIIILAFAFLPVYALGILTLIRMIRSRVNPSKPDQAADNASTLSTGEGSQRSSAPGTLASSGDTVAPSDCKLVRASYDGETLNDPTRPSSPTSSVAPLVPKSSRDSSIR